MEHLARSQKCSATNSELRLPTYVRTFSPPTNKNKLENGCESEKMVKRKGCPFKTSKVSEK